MSTIGQRLKKLREERNVTQSEVAAFLDIKRATLSKIETGGDKPGREVMAKLASYYDVSLDWLSTGLGPRQVQVVTARTADEMALLKAYRQIPEAIAQFHLELMRATAAHALAGGLPSISVADTVPGPRCDQG